MTPTELIQSREETHGDFIQGAEIFAQNMRPVAQKWLEGKIDNCQFYALTMINAKQTQILNGNAHFADHWEDGANYFTLGGRLNIPQEPLTPQPLNDVLELPIVNK
ncbi:hypothetical protein [Mannheimia massilioguelmaensis]|uniref:hypothetical protein n=1 Tax=Mannheimia massilioguelmaensis TaxID=1604354 RepID=UPI0005C9522C|nr:hypothetical protein [Mannheimia massilioguelmaensis]